MKKRVNKLSSLLIVLAMILSFGITPAYAEDLSLSGNVAACAEEMRAEYNEAISMADEEIDQEYLINNYEANITYNRLLNSIETDDTELRSHFSGAYVNDDGYLVVALCCDTEKCKKEIKDNLAESKVIFEAGVGSYYYGQKQLEEINESIASMQESITNGESVSASVQTLMQSKPRTVYNTKDNTTSVVFNVDAEVEKAVLKSERLTSGANAQTMRAELTASELQAVKQYKELIGAFKDNIKCSDGISYTVCSGYEQTVDQSDFQ